LRGEDIRQTDAAMQGRLSEMAAALLVFLEHPLRGVGPGNFPSHFVEKADLLGFTMHHGERRAHCLYLEVAAETGILGVGCFLVVLGLTVKNLLDAHAAADSKELQGMAASAIAAMVAMMATGVFLSFAYMRYYWLMIGLCSAIARIVLQSTHRSAAHVGSSAIEGTPP
jgi:O-antigen ligase